ncbi:MAG TPA: FAD-dependent oxidoreductase [Polyangiaceae bacterium]|nr:FAD-dependent oxidoreductase [Polyangiaceae bacterium]
MPPPPMFEARLVHARRLSPNVRELAFERVDGSPMVFEPGQWVNVLLPNELAAAGATKRSYSIASPPDVSARFDIAVTRVQGGPASTWLHTVEPQAVLTFTGPQGFFTRLPEGAPPSLMIATGTGMTPMRSMMRAAVAKEARAPMWLLLGVRHENDLLYGDELRALAAEHPFIGFEPTLSQPAGDWQGRRGYVQAHVRELWEKLVAASGSRPHAYVCGLERMVGSVRDLLRKEIGLPREQVHTERYD